MLILGLYGETIFMDEKSLITISLFGNLVVIKKYLRNIVVVVVVEAGQEQQQQEEVIKKGCCVIISCSCAVKKVLVTYLYFTLCFLTKSDNYLKKYKFKILKKEVNK